jgi:hypothetical protein
VIDPIIATQVRKFPLVLSRRPEAVADALESLRGVCGSRLQWQQDYERLTPSLLAFYLRDVSDILVRYERFKMYGGGGEVWHEGCIWYEAV